MRRGSPLRAPVVVMSTVRFSSSVASTSKAEPYASQTYGTMYGNMARMLKTTVYLTNELEDSRRRRRSADRTLRSRSHPGCAQGVHRARTASPQGTAVLSPSDRGLGRSDEGLRQGLIVLDTSGLFAYLNEPTPDRERIRRALKEEGMGPPDPLVLRPRRARPPGRPGVGSTRSSCSSPTWRRAHTTSFLMPPRELAEAST